jgi:hypothetical protein
LTSSIETNRILNVSVSKTVTLDESGITIQSSRPLTIRKRRMKRFVQNCCSLVQSSYTLCSSSRRRRWVSHCRFSGSKLPHITLIRQRGSRIRWRRFTAVQIFQKRSGFILTQVRQNPVTGSVINVQHTTVTHQLVTTSRLLRLNHGVSNRTGRLDRSIKAQHSIERIPAVTQDSDNVAIRIKNSGPVILTHPKIPHN